MDYSDLSHLSDQELLRATKAAVARQRATADAMLADAAVAEARGLEIPEDVKERIEELREERAGEPDGFSARLTPIAEGLFEVQIEMDLETYEKLLYARLLLVDEVPDGDFGRVLERALDALIEALERGEAPAVG